MRDALLGTNPPASSHPGVDGLSKRQRRSNQTHAILTVLHGHYSRCFVDFKHPRNAVFKPLAIGIDQKLLTLHPDMNKTQLNRALHRYTHSRYYLNVLRPGIERVDVNGTPSGECVTEAQAKGAKAMFKCHQKKSSSIPPKNNNTKQARQRSTDSPTPPTSSSEKSPEPVNLLGIELTQAFKEQQTCSRKNKAVSAREAS